MQINGNLHPYTPNFKAIKVADTRNTLIGVTTGIELFKLTREDRPFLNKLLEKTSYKELFPKLNQLLQERWQHVFEYCVKQAIDDSDQSYLAVCNNKPCGIMTCQWDGSSLYLDGLCAIPAAPDKKVPKAGTTLLYQLFKDAKEESAKSITLSAVQDGPFDVVKKYEALGFKKDITSYPYVKMECSKYEIAKQNTNLGKEIEYEKCEPERVNLEHLID